MPLVVLHACAYVFVFLRVMYLIVTDNLGFVLSCRHAWIGRLAIVFMAVVGTLPLIAGPSALDATTVSGTMVVGLGPPVSTGLLVLTGFGFFVNSVLGGWAWVQNVRSSP